MDLSGFRSHDGATHREAAQMKTDAVVRARIDGDAEARGTEALHAMSFSVSDAIRLPRRRVADEKRLPFVVQAPNTATVEVIAELEEGKGKGLEYAEEPLRDLGIRGVHE